MERCGGRCSVDELDALLSDEGWPYASTPPVEEGDPGRFNALFGRDSLIRSLQVLPGAAATSRGRRCARWRRARARATHPGTCEEPGKIGHEFRDRAPQGFLELGWPDQGEFAYYGTADATSWFLVVMATRARRAGRRARARLARGRGLARAARSSAAAGWSGTRRATGRRLTQQGWRDTIDPTASYGGGILRARRHRARARRSPTPTRRRSPTRR